MFFRLGPPPSSLSDSELGSGEWQRIPRLPVWAAQILSLPIGALLAFLVLMTWVFLTPHFDETFAAPNQVAIAMILVYLIGILLQIGAYPGMGLSNQSVLGIWPSRITAYTAHLSKITKWHLFGALLAPCFVLVILPLMFAIVFRVSSGWFVFVSCWAAALFGPNVILSLPAWRLPANCLIAGRGLQLYWRLP